MILVLCPTRGRPESVKPVIESLRATATNPDTRVLFVIDGGDPLLASYREQLLLEDPMKSVADFLVVPGGNMVKALNEATREALAFDPFITLLGFIGDDHRFRTLGWDTMFLSHVRGGSNVAMLYADDGIRTDIPTHVFVTPNVVHALGWFAPPMLHHLYVDNAWRALGEACEILYLFKDVLIEHMHPIAGKADPDAGYLRVNAPEVYAHDRRAFEEWRHSGAFKEATLRIMGMTYRPSGGRG